jgi:hemolysin activation/secretion protein
MGYDDTGTRFTGLERGFIGFSWANALNRDHMMGYQFTGSSDTKKLNAHAGVYEIPLANRDILQFYGSYAEVSSDFVQPFTQDGVAWQAALRYRRELCDWGCLQHHVLGGFDFKQTNTNLEFGGDQVFASSADIIQFLAGYRGNWTDGWYSLYLAADVVYGPSGLSGNNTDPAYQTIRTGAKADYVYGRAIVEGVAPVNSWLDFVARITGQLAGENLLPSEQLGFGGFDSIRGYDMRLVNGDSGYFLNLEARTIPFCLGPYGGETQFLAFFDYGNADNHTLLPGEDVSVDLSSVGLGLRYALDDTASLRRAAQRGDVSAPAATAHSLGRRAGVLTRNPDGSHRRLLRPADVRPSRSVHLRTAERAVSRASTFRVLTFRTSGPIGTRSAASTCPSL